MNEELKNKLIDKKQKAISRIKAKGYDLLDYMIDHPLKSAAIGIVTTKIVKGIWDDHVACERQLAAARDRMTREYDPESKCYYRVRRPLTNRENRELNKRRQRGENVGDILASMKLLD